MTSKPDLEAQRIQSEAHKKQREAIHSVPWPSYVQDTTSEWSARMKGRVFDE